MPISYDEIEEIDENPNEINTKYSTYLTDSNNDGPREPTYSKEIGFAIEKIKDGFNLKDLWEVLPASSSSST